MRILFFILLFFCFNASSQTSVKKHIQKIKLQNNDNSILKSLDSLSKKVKMDTETQLLWYSAYVFHAQNSNKYDIAIKYSLKGIDLSKKSKNDTIELTFLRFAGNSYYLSNLKDQALKIWLVGEKKSKSKANHFYGAAFANNLGAIYLEKGNYNLAEQKLLYSIEMMQKIGKENTINGIRTNRILASLYEKKKDYKKASKIYLNVINLAKTTNDSILTGSSIMYYCNFFTQQQKFDSAFYYSNLASNYLNKTKDTTALLMQLGIQRILFEKTKNYEDAYYVLDSVFRINSKQNITSIGKSISDIRIKYETDKKEQDLELKKNQLALSKERSNFILTLSFLVVFVILISAVFIYFRIRLKQKLKNEVERILKEKEINESKEKERTRIARELHDNIGSTISYITNKTESILEENNSEELKKADLVQVKESAQEIMIGLRETLWALNSKEITNFDLADKLKVYIKKHALIPYSIEDKLVIEHIIPNESALAIFRCSQEIINNCNKHSKAKNLKIQFISANNVLIQLNFEDDGIGFDFSEKAESYGLKNIKSRLEEINAVFEIESKKNLGTCFKISLNF